MPFLRGCLVAQLLSSPVVLGFAIALGWRRRYPPGRFFLAGLGLSVVVALVESAVVAIQLYLVLLEVSGTEAA